MPPGWSSELDISPLLAQIIWSRGYTSIASANQYLNAPLSSLTHPDKWPYIPQAAQILVKELIAGRKMAVWGDYDADGITSTALVLDVLQFHGFNILHHLPNRIDEGYGLNLKYLEKLAAEGCEVLLTVDCGISNYDVIERARQMGMKVIVSDHHLPGEKLPNADAIVDPRIGKEADWPCPSLAGVGVAFYLMGAVNALLAEHTGKRFKMANVLDLVALGTLADVMELKGENRVLVRAGLKMLERSQRLGISALKEKCRLGVSDALNSEQTVFLIAPRINAAGRMGNPHLALDLLRSTSMELARSYALDLNECNQHRKDAENAIYESALLEAEKLVDKSNPAAIIVAGNNWHTGIIGIVASRLVEKFEKPAIVLSREGNLLKGSARSTAGVNLHEALENSHAFLTAFGGHSMAAGLVMEETQLENFRAAFNQEISKQIATHPYEKIIELDAEAGFEITSQLDFIEELQMMEPFGPGNPQPVFASPTLKVLGRSFLGSRTDCVKLMLEDEKSGIKLPAKVWRRASEFPASMVGSRIRMAYTPAINSWNGCKTVEIIPLDWHKE